MPPNTTFCPPPAHQRPSVCLAAPAEAGQGAGTLNVDDEVHVALSDVFGRLRDSGLSIAAANSAIYYSLFRLGYLERGRP
ncbi:hypothetical protein AcdelDRAFT_1342 [Acidovorax delafieldii 2AN]|uniref:Uncharacterized protein n=1 Tax=Acidovorax delafieldii 2AN TaxID=573060 RepID=C5T362_ACIDE|nr:hypothetical protein AcdelDRAFT_1342 [Acidovorax delafieldii 2AN]